MAEEQDKGQKTEKPTPRKIQEARKEGNYAKSTDVNSAAVLIFGILSLAFFGSGFWLSLQKKGDEEGTSSRPTCVAAACTALLLS